MTMADVFSSAHISVHLASDSLIACEVQRRWGLRRLTRTASFSFHRGERSQAMQRLGAWIGDAPARRTLGWVIGPSEAQYFVLPWSPEAVDLSLRDSYARARYEQLYERDARTAAFSFATPAASGEQVVSCIPLALNAELHAHARAAGCTLHSIKPSLVAVWQRFRDVLESEQGTLYLLDGDQQAIVHHNKRRIHHVEVARLRPGLSLREAGAGVLRRFSNLDLPRAATDLQLPRWRGSEEAQDSRYAFALCGAY
ncbi:hypothetical protein PGB34_00150 [Xenophilus arseniciresistens]|jgi:hypothetical protein|uniref:Uncharacterized protein n=1 Tax=Xenophilus arseniciresistens TaxID=1283306 RepID=A0AAE3N554_9BURK|nr:hypothetical protein [Xenophilus arseniciresistens]MDA7414759.1 hypothetical protein [Xenophilus arseniciresistens]